MEMAEVRRLDRIVVVGGGLAASRSCAALRRQGHDGDIVLIAAEPHMPYDRPPLSKGMLHGTCTDPTLPVDLTGLGVQIQLGTAATGLRPGERTVATVSDQVTYDGLVIATGASPIRLPGDGEQLLLRTVDDARVLRDRLVTGARIVVIGASWIGAEVVTAAIAAGCRVTCLEAGTGPAAQVFGAEVAERFMPWWEGVDLRCGTAVARVECVGVLLKDGTLVPADTVITGIGVRPETGWLEGSGLQLDRGVVVDERLYAAPGIVAVGDVTARWSPRWNRRLRITHWDDASSGPAVAAASLLAEADTGPVYDPVPYFWSDQFGHKVQYLGQLGTEDKPEFCEPADGRGWSVAWFDAERRLTAVLAVDRPRDIAQARRLLASDSPRLVAT
jgi:3-phenylpropionate/trans-cinnamate dioxygenase ferredoxin reductase component